MSLMDKIKAMFSGGADTQESARSDVPLDELAIDEVPPAPVDPLGTPMPDAPPAATPPLSDRDEQL